MAFSLISPREICVVLMLLCAVALALRLRTRVTRAVWLTLLVAGITNALVLNAQSYNLIHNNLVHYYLGAKYPVPYRSFYKAINAALDKPQIGTRDLERFDRLVRTDLKEQRAYYIDLMRADAVDFEPLASLPQLRQRAVETGALHREAQRILTTNLPSNRIENFRGDVIRAATRLVGRDLTLDAGFNGSPFYALVRHADPTLYGSLGSPTAWLNLVWQTFAVLAIAWLLGLALGLELNHRLAMAALVFASWDFASYAFPGLIFGGMWFPIAASLYAIHRRRVRLAGVAVAWAGLIKVFPFVLLLPAVVRIGRAALARSFDWYSSPLWRGWIKLLAWCAIAAVVFAFASTLAGRSWLGFLDKIMAQFGAKTGAGNNVSLTKALWTVGIGGPIVTYTLSLLSLASLAAMFLGGSDDDAVAAVPRRSLVVLGSLGWVTHMWLNYYAVAVLFLLPLLAQRHRVGAAACAVAFAISYALPEFSGPLIAEYPFLLTLKLIPYVAIPAWLVVLEFRAIRVPRIGGRIAVIAGAACLLLVAIETWRLHTIRISLGKGNAALHSGDESAAIALYNRTLKISPRNPHAFNGKAVAYVNLDETDLALANFERAARFNPTDARVQRNYGRFLLMSGRTDQAAEVLAAARSVAPYDDGILLDLARARLAQGRRAEAEAALTRSLELNPSATVVKDLLREVRKTSQ